MYIFLTAPVLTHPHTLHWNNYNISDMKFINVALTELKKTFSLPFIFFSFLFTVIFFLLQTGYIDSETEKEFSIIYIMLHMSEFDMMEAFSWQSMAVVNIGDFFAIFVPCLLSLNAICLRYEEIKSGYLSHEKIRYNSVKFKSAVTITEVAISGIVAAAAYFIFFIIVRFFFKDISAFNLPEEIMVTYTYSLGLNLSKWFLYGITSCSLYLLFFEIFRDRNLCISVGIFFVFLYNLILRKIYAYGDYTNVILTKITLTDPLAMPLMWVFITLFCIVFIIVKERITRAKNV